MGPDYDYAIPDLSDPFDGNNSPLLQQLHRLGIMDQRAVRIDMFLFFVFGQIEHHIHGAPHAHAEPGCFG